MIKNILRFIITNSVSISILIGAFLISIAIWWPMTLDEIEKMASIFVSILAPFSIFVAISTYKNARQQDNTTSTIDQVSFIRREVIPFYDKLNKDIKDKHCNYTFPRVILINQNFQTTVKKYRQESDAQLEIIIDSNNKYSSIYSDQVWLLNMLEEFALKVLHFGTIHHEALNSTKDTFVSAVESNLVALFITRSNNSSKVYTGVLKLYSLWQNEVDRRSLEAKNAQFRKVFFETEN